MRDEGELCREDPPLAGKCQVTALHVIQRDILAPADLDDMFSKASAQRPLAFGGPFRRFADVHKPILEVQGIDATDWRPYSFCEREQWT